MQRFPPICESRDECGRRISVSKIMKIFAPILLAALPFVSTASAQFAFQVGRASPNMCFQPARPQVCWSAGRWTSPGWGWNNGWNNFGWGAGGVFITYGNPRPGISSGFGTIRVPETRVHRVPPPIQLTEPLVIHEGTSFRWRR